MKRLINARRAGLAIAAAALLAPPAIAADDAPTDAHHVAGAGTVVIDESNPYAGGESWTFALDARTDADGTASGHMQVVFRDPDDASFAIVNARIDCLRVDGRTATVSAVHEHTVVESGPTLDYENFRFVVQITDGDAADRLVFGHGLPSEPDCSDDVLGENVPTMPVLGNYIVR